MITLGVFVQKFTVMFQDERRPTQRPTESIDVEAESSFNAIPVATALFFQKYPEERIQDFWVECTSA